MFGRRPLVKCFNATYRAGSYAGRADLGYHVVRVDQIVGSVGRCDELDAKFRPLKLTALREERMKTIRELMNRGAPLPPVELYKLKDEYFVIDGNHRVAIAKENKQAYIDAHVIEFLPDGQRAEDQLYLERHAFALETGLEGIRLSQIGGFPRLLEEIKRHQATMSSHPDGVPTLKEAAQDWRQRVYQPAVQAILAQRLPERFPGSALGDLYLDVQGRRIYCHECQGQDLSLQAAVARMAAEHPLPTRKQRLQQAWRQLVGQIEAWWYGLRATDAPCAFAAQAPDGHIYCRRATRAKRF